AATGWSRCAAGSTSTPTASTTCPRRAARTGPTGRTSAGPIRATRAEAGRRAAATRYTTCTPRSPDRPRCHCCGPSSVGGGAARRGWGGALGAGGADRRSPLRGSFSPPLPAHSGSQFVRVGETFNGVLQRPGGNVSSREVTVQDIWLRSILGARRFIYMEEQY